MSKHTPDTPEIHPLANIFPMEESTIRQLADDIQANGQQYPIELFEDKVLDGRRRLAACQLAGILPEYLNVSPDDPVAYVLSLNLYRRHLSESQRAMVAAKVKEKLQPEAKKRQARKSKSVGANLPPQNEPKKTRDVAAEQLKVSPRSVDHGSTVLKHGSPELVEAVEQGDVAVSKAAEVAKSTPKEEQLEVAKQAAPKSPSKNPHKQGRDIRKLWEELDSQRRGRFLEWIHGNHPTDWRQVVMRYGAPGSKPLERLQESWKGTTLSDHTKFLWWVDSNCRGELKVFLGELLTKEYGVDDNSKASEKFIASIGRSLDWWPVEERPKVVEELSKLVEAHKQ